MHTVRSKETQRDLLKKIIPCVIKCNSISNSLASNQGIVMASFVLEAIKKSSLTKHAYT